MKQRGFTLIELLVVISILGVLAGLIVNNLNDSRARARDARKKQNLNQMKTALRLYYNDYQAYPASSGFGCGVGKMNYMMACGDDGDECCPCDSETDFGAGTDCATTYMTSFPDGFGNNSIAYYQTDSETYCLKSALENASDPDIESSQTNCASACSGYVSASDYAVCSD